METGDRSLTNEQDCGSHSDQGGDHCFGSSIHQEGRSDVLHQPKKCLFPDSNSSQSGAALPVFAQGHNLPVEICVLSFNSIPGLYQSLHCSLNLG